MAAWLRMPAPAKLNLMLRIVGRRADGYHLLQSAIDPIDWCDEVRLRRRHDGRIVRRHGSRSIPAESDLAVRAARLLKAHAGVRTGAELDLRKRVPMGAGLGGGSADAAAVLLGLNRLWGLRWRREALSALALQLGADVVALLWQAPVWVAGIGEQVRTLDLPARHYVVIWPGVAAATAAMYAHPDLRRDAPALDAGTFDREIHRDNAFEPLARQLWPQIGAALDWLRARLPAARLTGSGSALFAEAPDRSSACRIARAVPHVWRARACRSWRAPGS